MGLDARIMAAAEHEWKRRMRFGAYVGAAVRELVRLETARFRIEADGDAIEIDGYLALVANAGELVPGRIGPRQPIDPADGRLDLIVLGGQRSAGRPARRRASCMLRPGRPRAAASSGGPSARSRIEAEPAQPIETDGDHHPPGRLEAGSSRGPSRSLVPAAADGAESTRRRPATASLWP